jgi:hypothetical protein
MRHDPDGPSAAEIRRAIEIEANTLSAPPKPDGGEAAACVHKAREKIKRCLPGLVDMLLSVANGPNTPATIFLRLKATGYLLAIAGISSETEEQAARDA